MPPAVELPIATLDGGTVNATDLANEIFGAGVTVNSATYSGDLRSAGIYSNGDTVSTGVTPGDTGVILSTGLAEDFTNSDGTLNTNQATNRSTNTAGVDNDTDFNALAGAGTRDASFLEIDFTPAGDTLTIDFVISSEEYPEFVNSAFLDVVGVWVNGTEAQVSIGNGTASIGNINGAQTPNIYNDNTGDAFNTEMDGFTVTLTFVAPVNVGVTNTIKIGVADVADANFDSNLLIAGGSAQTVIVAQDDSITMGNNDTSNLDVLANDSSTAGTLTVTQINGMTATVGSPITLGTGQQVTLNADGTFTIAGDGDAETVYFNYTIEDTSGNTDTALVEVTQTPCFVEGTRIETPKGPRPIETLRIGQRIITRDRGPMRIRWIGSTKVEAKGKLTPVRISAGSFGASRDILLSPNHRVLLQDLWAELMFGQAEVLVKAKDLVNHKTVRWAPSEDGVTYYHILLDSHQLLSSDGLVSESYHPGAQTLDGFDQATFDEIALLFPSLVGNLGGYGPSARLSLKSSEARLLMTQCNVARAA